ncbi:hypothetical protein QJS10_CPB22g01068 [Acorus calamus]|uniref:Uncharacterized protein n=1 Tax=Acorus calamus TaxID=4465 RepID=A0AAV9C3N4_ACOCL|nr:hypothetical protein QJS10_CPB22g01068 [Acorus calamus]
MATSSPSNLSNGEFVGRRQKREPPFKFLVPLVYAPILPLIRIAFRRNPILRDRLFFGVLAFGFAHGTYLVSDLYDAESKS